ncbi:MAG: ribonuclease HII [Bdellovibrionales bacterium]|nr:ribonuclease HII [Bdellovibrionales bacterium]
MVKEKNSKKKIPWRSSDWKKLAENQPVVGVDEAGRGCLVGRVYAGAVCIKDVSKVRRYTDSKLISEERREEIFEEILATQHVGVGFAEAWEIEKINILQASFLAMKRALEMLSIKSGVLLVDGHLKVPGLIGFEQIPIVKGDLRAKPISAASIVAKVSRDRWVRELSKKYPGYGFETHKGYATEFHYESLRRLGPCPEHRKTFKGIQPIPGSFAGIER